MFGSFLVKSQKFVSTLYDLTEKTSFIFAVLFCWNYQNLIDFYRYEKEEREKKLRRLREDQQRMAMAQRGRGGMMQRGGPMRGGMIRGRGGVMLSRGGIKRPLQGHTGPRPSFQYRDGSFICDLCKKSFSDGNDMVSSLRLAFYECNNMYNMDHQWCTGKAP